METTMFNPKMDKNSQDPYVENLVQMIRVFQHRESEQQLTIERLCDQLCYSESKRKEFHEKSIKAAEALNELKGQKGQLGKKFERMRGFLKKAQIELVAKYDENKKALSKITELKTELSKVKKELKFAKNDVLDKKILLNAQKMQKICNEKNPQAAPSAEVDELKKELKDKNRRIKELHLHLHFLQKGSSAESQHVERVLKAKVTIANKQIFNLEKELAEEKERRTQVETMLKTACRRINGLDFPHTGTMFVQLNKKFKLDHSCCDVKQLTESPNNASSGKQNLTEGNRSESTHDEVFSTTENYPIFPTTSLDHQFLNVNVKTLQKVQLLEWVLVEQEKAMQKQRRLYEEKIADLESALYMKTREIDEAGNSVDNVEWKKTVNHVLEYDTTENQRLEKQLKAAMVLIGKLQDSHLEARNKEKDLKNIVEQMREEFETLRMTQESIDAAKLEKCKMINQIPPETFRQD